MLPVHRKPGYEYMLFLVDPKFTGEQIQKQMQILLNSGWLPASALEFEARSNSSVAINEGFKMIWLERPIAVTKGGKETPTADVKTDSAGRTET